MSMLVTLPWQQHAPIEPHGSAEHVVTRPQDDAILPECQGLHGIQTGRGVDPCFLYGNFSGEDTH